jgi:hypothetical protein
MTGRERLVNKKAAGGAGSTQNEQVHACLSRLAAETAIS